MIRNLLNLFRRKPMATAIHRSIRTTDVAYAYRMPGGVPGDINRTHPVSVEPALQDATTPSNEYGQAVVVDTTANSVRRLTVGDAAITRIYGIAARPYPQQQSSASNYGAATLGAAVPPATGVIDIVREGYIMSRLRGATAATKDGLVYVWVAASSGAHVQGGFEAAADSGNTAAIGNARFNGPADPDGNVEVIVHMA